MTELRLKQIFDKTSEGYDDISHSKRLIMERLYSDPDVIEVLNNLDLDPSIPEDYVEVNLFSRLVIPNMQNEAKNYICFEVEDTEDMLTNDIMMTKVVTFIAVANEQEATTKWGIDRHDLLGYLIKDLFNWSNIIGLHLKKFYDGADVSDNGYYYRVIKFKTVSINGLVHGVGKNRYDQRN